MNLSMYFNYIHQLKGHHVEPEQTVKNRNQVRRTKQSQNTRSSSLDERNSFESGEIRHRYTVPGTVFGV